VDYIVNEIIMYCALTFKALLQYYFSIKNGLTSQNAHSDNNACYESFEFASESNCTPGARQVATVTIFSSFNSNNATDLQCLSRKAWDHRMGYEHQK
jgi:hypothetical protein